MEAVFPQIFGSGTDTDVLQNVFLVFLIHFGLRLGLQPIAVTENDNIVVVAAERRNETNDRLVATSIR